jgi:ribosome biogenesis GTPase
MELKEIGWSAFFDQAFSKFEKDGLVPARVISELKKKYILCGESGMFEAGARGILWHLKSTTGETPVVGDWVAVDLIPENNSASIKAILPRKSSFSRKASGGRKKTSGGRLEEQVIAANIDIALIVSGLDRDYNLRRIERYIALTRKSNTNPLIILNKADLCQDARKIRKEVATIYPDIPVITMIALKRRQVEVLNKYIKVGQTAALLGSSGVGKSTIINQLVGYDRQKVTEVSESAGKGQHTTSRRELIITSQGKLIMDNPGMREIQLWAEENDLFEAFEDIETVALDCRFNNCRHENEPGCAVRLALSENKLDEARVSNYIKMRIELEHLAEKQKLSKKSHR